MFLHFLKDHFAAGPSISGRSSNVNNGSLLSAPGASGRASRGKGRGGYRQLADDEASADDDEVTLFVGGHQPHRNGNAARGGIQNADRDRPGRPGHVTFHSEVPATSGPSDGRTLFDRLGLDANGNSNGSTSVNMDELDPELARHVQKQQACLHKLPVDS